MQREGLSHLMKWVTSSLTYFCQFHPTELVGTRYSALPPMDLKAFVNATAKCSYDYFVSSRSSQEVENLSRAIGQWSGILTKEEIEQILNGFINDIEFGRLT
jgi:hypothetical protein